jgi:hypothetical protein
MAIQLLLIGFYHAERYMDGQTTFKLNLNIQSEIFCSRQKSPKCMMYIRHNEANHKHIQSCRLSDFRFDIEIAVSG